MGKSKEKLLVFRKLCDANKAGTKTSKKCTLILTEGDSAKTTAVAGLSPLLVGMTGVSSL